MINFRDTLAKYKHLTLMGINNALSARLAEQAGFQALWSSSLEVSASHGVPDASFLGMNQFVEAAHQAQTAVDIPILADCDSGYGDSMNVAYMVRSYEDAGITAVCMEDNLFPKVNSLLDQRRTILGADEFVQKIVAAKSAQREDSFFVMARTESFIAGESVDELLARAEAYREAGADALLFHAKAPPTPRSYARLSPVGAASSLWRSCQRPTRATRLPTSRRQALTLSSSPTRACVRPSAPCRTSSPLSPSTVRCWTSRSRSRR